MPRCSLIQAKVKAKTETLAWAKTIEVVKELVEVRLTNLGVSVEVVKVAIEVKVAVEDNEASHLIK